MDMVDFFKVMAIILWTMLAVYWGLVAVVALKGFSVSVILYIVYGIFATGATIFYTYLIRSI